MLDWILRHAPCPHGTPRMVLTTVLQSHGYNKVLSLIHVGLHLSWRLPRALEDAEVPRGREQAEGGRGKAGGDAAGTKGKGRDYQR